MTDLDDHGPEEIAQGTSDYIRTDMLSDELKCDEDWHLLWRWRYLMQGSIVLYDFSKGKRDDRINS